MLSQDELHNKGDAGALLVDAMLGRLTHWLRLVGYDATYWRTGSDDDLVLAARSEGRLIITRDRQLAGGRGVPAFLVTAETLSGQISEVRAALGGHPVPFSRCPECNGRLHELPHQDALGLVPTYVWHTQPSFRRCTGCGRIYWRGTHWPGLAARLEEK